MPTLSSARFEFAGSDNVGVARFECRLDGGGWDSCTSPYGYGGLAVGEHQFEVRAVDTAGNVDPTPAARRWTSINRRPADGLFPSIHSQARTARPSTSASTNCG